MTKPEIIAAIDERIDRVKTAIRIMRPTKEVTAQFLDQINFLTTLKSQIQELNFDK